MGCETYEVADACRDVIAAAWSPSGPDAVTRVWARQIGLDPDSVYPLLEGRKVYVIPGGWDQDGVLDRSARLVTHSVGVLVCERYTDAPGEVPDAWLDERVQFTRQFVADLLSDPGLVLTVPGGSVRVKFDERQGIDVLVDRDALVRNKTFWSVCSFTFREVV